MVSHRGVKACDVIYGTDMFFRFLATLAGQVPTRELSSR